MIGVGGKTKGRERVLFDRIWECMGEWEMEDYQGW